MILLCLDCDIAFPSPTLAKVGDGAAHGHGSCGMTTLPRRPAPPLFIVFAAAKDRAPGREHEHCSTTGDHWLGRIARLAHPLSLPNTDEGHSKLEEIAVGNPRAAKWRLWAKLVRSAAARAPEDFGRSTSPRRKP